MLLSARMLANVANVNTYDTVSSVQFTEGDTVTVYLQLIDLTKDKISQNLSSSGRRYIPSTPTTLKVTISNIDATKTVTKIATAPFTGDTSIWSFSLASTDKVSGTYNLTLELVENGVTTRGFVNMALSVTPLNRSFI